MTPFLVTSFTPTKSRVMIEWLCLEIYDNGRSQVARTACDRASSHDGGSMIDFLLKN
jgi:hypothetical protein